MLVVGVLSPGQDVLVTSEVGLLVQNPAATLHLDGVAAAEVRLSVGAVAVALESAALEVSFLVEDDLQRGFTSLESLLILIFKKWRKIFFLFYLTAHPEQSSGPGHLVKLVVSQSRTAGRQLYKPLSKVPPGQH